jgi:hypothetical protein
MSKHIYTKVEVRLYMTFNHQAIVAKEGGHGPTFPQKASGSALSLIAMLSLKHTSYGSKTIPAWRFG